MLDFYKLLENDNISGEEVGKFIIYNDILTYKHQTGKFAEEDLQSPVTQDMLDSLIEKIDTVEDAENLECYVQLQNFVRYAQAVSFAYNQQAQNGFCRLLMYMTQAQQVEHARKNLEMLPMIMTENQFLETEYFGRIARLRGVAIVANNFPCRPKCLDLKDHFIEPEIDCFQEMMSLEHSEEIANKIEYFRNDMMLGGLRHQMAYNKLFELIAEQIGIPEFIVFQTDIYEMKKQINDFNKQREAFADEIAGEGKEYFRKLEILERVFRPISLDNIEPTENSIKKVKELLSDISVLRTSLDYMVSVLINDEVN